MNDIPVSMVMSSNLKTLSPKDKLIKARDLFDHYDLHHILVVEDGALKGIISKGDILYLQGVATSTFDEFIKEKKFQMTTLDAMMTIRPRTIESHMFLSDALDIMLKHRINALPVTSANELVGILTSYDVMYYIKDELINTKKINNNDEDIDSH